MIVTTQWLRIGVFSMEIPGSNTVVIFFHQKNIIHISLSDSLNNNPLHCSSLGFN